MRATRRRYLGLEIVLGAVLVFFIVYNVVRSRTYEPVEGETEFTVVTSSYPMYIAAENVIGDCGNVTLENLTEDQTGCVHDYQLTTEDMRLLSTADVFIVNGGGIESYLTEVAEQYPDLLVVDASEGISLLEDNPHVWMSLERYEMQVINIRAGLISADPDEARGEAYSNYSDNYSYTIEELGGAVEEIAEATAGQPVVLLNESFEYLAADFGMDVVGVMDLDEGREVSAAEVAGILSVIEEKQVPFVLAEEQYGKEMGDMIEEETGATVLYLDTLTSGDYGENSYVSGMVSNVEIIRKAYTEGEEE